MSTVMMQFGMRGKPIKWIQLDMQDQVFYYNPVSDFKEQS